jgi:putative nucleotidyltransferase with HDIG domain
MDRFKIKKSSPFSANVLLCFLFMVVTIVLIVWFLPRESRFNFQFQQGKPWQYGTLIAKFDFPVMKSDETIKRERDSLLRQYEPYYSFNDDVEKRELEQFRSDYKNGIQDLPPEFVSVIAINLHKLYQQGIIDPHDYNELIKDTTQRIRIVSGKEARSIKVAEFNSTMTAYEKLFTEELLSQNRQILQKCNLNNYIEPNLVFDKERSETAERDIMTSVPLASGVVLTGQKIIDRGEIVDARTNLILTSFQQELAKRGSNSQQMRTMLLGQIFLVSLLVISFTIYLRMFFSDYLEKPRNLMMLYALILIFPILTSLMVQYNLYTVYLIPYVMVPIFIRVFMDSRTAFMAHVITILLCAPALRFPFEFIVVELIAGIVAIFTLKELYRRSQLFKTALIVTMTYAATYLSLELINNDDVNFIDRSMYYYFIINGILLLFVYPLMYLIEKMFGFTSNVTLVELSNTNNDLLRKLSEVAPGTFQHSIQVGNLAAEVTNKINGNSALVRTGALYHDIGKMLNPAFFTENQNGVNPHLNLSYIESAQIIIAHVTDGIKLADKYNLPGIIKDFISTHHGVSKTKYFYVSYMNEHPNEEIDDLLFTYPGPNPFTKEQAVLMMADSVEASSRSLSEYTEKSISDNVCRIIDSQVKEGCFRDCPITFRDIETAKSILTEKLKSIYHTRISYPELVNRKS